MPHTVFPETDPLKAMEDAAYAGVESEAEARNKREYRDYAHLGSAIGEPRYRPGVLREWPIHTDFRPDNLHVRD